jgi:hypothetical protein
MPFSPCRSMARHLLSGLLGRLRNGCAVFVTLNLNFEVIFFVSNGCDIPKGKQPAWSESQDDDESISGCAGLLKHAFWAAAMTGGERVAHEGIFPGLLIGGPLGADFRHPSGNARPFEAQ